MLASGLSFFKKYLNKDHLFIYILCISIFFATTLIIICIGSTLTADDYQFFDVVNSQSYFNSMTHFGTEISGRYGFAFTVITFIKILKLKALSILPISSLVLLLIGTTYGTVRYLKLTKKDTPSTTKLAMATAIFAALATLISAPSIFDTFIWFSATPVYVTSYAVLFMATSLVLRDLYDDRVRVWIYVFIFLLLVFAAGFLEVIPIELALVGLVGLLSSVRRKQTLDIPNLKLKIYSILFLAAGLISGSLLRFSPWTSNRIATGHHYSVSEIFSITFGHLQLIPQFIFNWHIAFSVIVGILIYLCIGKIQTQKNTIITFGLSVSLVFIPLLIVGVLASASGLIEATGMASNRLLYVGTSGIFLGLALLTYCIISLFIKPTNVRVQQIGTLLLATLLVVCFIGSVGSLSKVTQAVYIKKSMVEYREAVIYNDLASHRTTVRILAAPILLANSQVNDIGFGSPKVEVWSTALHGYYHIPPTTKLSFDSVAPAGYCTVVSDSVIYGKQTCEEIVSSADSLNYTTYP
jgi:hypothetical protein